MEGLIDGGSEADVAIVHDHPNTSARFSRVPRAVVYHHHFKIGERLARQGGEALVESLVRRQGRNNHGHRWVDLARPSFSYHRRLSVASKPRAKT